jgi:hypothetical protein
MPLWLVDLKEMRAVRHVQSNADGLDSESGRLWDVVSDTAEDALLRAALKFSHERQQAPRQEWESPPRWMSQAQFQFAQLAGLVDYAWFDRNAERLLELNEFSVLAAGLCLTVLRSREEHDFDLLLAGKGRAPISAEVALNLRRAAVEVRRFSSPYAPVQQTDNWLCSAWFDVLRRRGVRVDADALESAARAERSDVFLRI